jgi:hypothetical protein
LVTGRCRSRDYRFSAEKKSRRSMSSVPLIEDKRDNTVGTTRLNYLGGNGGDIAD